MHSLSLSFCRSNYFPYNLLGCKATELYQINPAALTFSNTPIHIKVQRLEWRSLATMYCPTLIEDLYCRHSRGKLSKALEWMLQYHMHSGNRLITNIYLCGITGYYFLWEGIFTYCGCSHKLFQIYLGTFHFKYYVYKNHSISFILLTSHRFSQVAVWRWYE